MLLVNGNGYNCVCGLRYTGRGKIRSTQRTLWKITIVPMRGSRHTGHSSIYIINQVLKTVNSSTLNDQPCSLQGLPVLQPRRQDVRTIGCGRRPRKGLSRLRQDCALRPEAMRSQGQVVRAVDGTGRTFKDARRGALRVV